MTLDEAINDTRESHEIQVWLSELRRARIEIELLEMTRDRYKADAEKYKAENAKLRHDLEEANNQAEEVCIENAKLRELVKDFLDVPCQCLKCEHYNYEEDRCDLRDRASELGVEVD